jgi:chemotaxis response regulator CheB
VLLAAFSIAVAPCQVEAREGEKIERGRAYVAPSDRHTLLAERLAETASSASRDVKLIREILDRL